MNEHRLPAEDDPRTFWEEYYGATEPNPHHPGGPNPTLVETASVLRPGRALDLGCGEGGDTLWLAEHGWHVTAVDISATVLRRVADRAARAGVTERVRTDRHDLGASFPTGSYDLVTAHYLQSPAGLPRHQVLKQAAGAVALGGQLLVVTHAEPPPWAWTRGPEHAHQHGHDLFPSAEEDWAALALPAADWELLRLGRQERAAVGPEGEPGSLLDGLITARRRG